MSGVGKTTVLGELSRRAIDVVDTDDGSWVEVVDGETRWKLDDIIALLERPRGGPLVIQGTVENQGSLYDRFDSIVLLTAPESVILERLRTRTTNPYGKLPAEVAKVRNEIRDVEPLLRRGATHVIDTSGSLSDVVDAVERIARQQ